jgi:hypothetical protein
MTAQIITTVVTPATAAQKIFVDLATVKSYLNIKDGTEDAFLNLLRGWVSAEIIGYCNRVLAVEKITDEFWPPRDPFPQLLSTGIKPLQLTRFPIIANGVTSVIENGVTLVDGTDYRVDYANGQITRLNADSTYPRQWPAWALAVTYSAGFAPMDPPIVDAALRMISARRSARGRDPYSRQRSVPGVLEEQFWIPTGVDAGNMPPDVSDILDNYRLPVIAS